MAFAIVTVYLFNYPSLQFIAHMMFTLLTIVYYAHAKLFEDFRRRNLEIFTDFMLLAFSCQLQQFLDPSISKESRKYQG